MCGDSTYAAVGVHPHNTANVSEISLRELEELAARPEVVAIGEIGLDYYRDLSPRDRQRDAFERQLALAVAVDLPVVIHCRDAGPDLLSIVRPFQGRLRAGVMHCFGGDAAFAERCLETGLYISFAGNVTYPNAVALREAAQIVPLDRLLVETDSPYLAPQQVRGKRCEPVHVRYTAERVAEKLGLAGSPEFQGGDPAAMLLGSLSVENVKDTNILELSMVGRDPDKVAEWLPDRHETIVVREPPRNLWDTWRLLVLVVALLTVEWAVRKRFRLM